MNVSTAISRHSWVWLRPDWIRFLCSEMAPEHEAAVNHWVSMNRPVIVTSQKTGDSGDTLRLGLATPDKRRICIHIRSEAATKSSVPIPLAMVISSAPPLWRAPLEKLDRAARTLGCVLSAYGALAWQQMSGLNYVTPASDADILIQPSNKPGLTGLLRELEILNAEGTPPIDGEIVLTNGMAVAWRELSVVSPHVLVKGHFGPALMNRMDVLDHLAG